MITKTLFFLTASAAFSSGAVVSGADSFVGIGDTNISTNGNSVEWSSSNAGTGSDQGSAVKIDATAIDITNNTPLYFQFGTTVASVETDFYYGQESTQVTSAQARRSDQNAFSVGISTAGDVFARQNGNTTLSFSNLQSLPAGTEVMFDIVVNVTPGFKFSSDITASYDNGGTLVSQTLTGVSGNQNNIGTVNNFFFHAIGTQGLADTDSFILSNFIGSTSPIPEPSSGLLLIAGASIFAYRRRRN